MSEAGSKESSESDIDEEEEDCDVETWDCFAVDEDIDEYVHPFDRQVPREQVYTKLDPSMGAIRLLRLLGSADNDAPIECHLAIYSLDDEPYDALPYTWGSSALGKSVYVNGSRFVVTDNLAAALRRLRLPDKPRTIWIDALCINQDDLAERAYQVAIMGQIYRKAA